MGYCREEWPECTTCSADVGSFQCGTGVGTDVGTGERWWSVAAVQDGQSGASGFLGL